MSKLTQGLFVALAVSALTLSTASAQSLKGTVVHSGFSRPVFLTSPAGDPDRMFVVEQHTGRIEIIRSGSILPTPFLTVPGVATGNEQGLLGLAFHPDFLTNGEFFVHYNTSGSGAARIAKHTVSGTPLTNDVANPAGDIILTFTQPFSNHNGGMIAFGDDGYLYIGTGDGGSGGDPGDRAQNPALILGKMLRIDVDGDDFPADTLRDYAIPPGQPSFGAGAIPELWQIGLRNPWRWSFDRDNGDMWIGDVGQTSREELDLDEGGVGGQNWGWRCKEGTNCFTSSSFCNCATPTLVDPVYDYNWSPGFSITGGYAYRGPLTCIQGLYFFSDTGSGQIRTAEKDGLGGVTVVNRTSEFGLGGIAITSFGEDDAGNLYMLNFLGGQVIEIGLTTPCPPEGVDSCNGDGGDQLGCTNCPCTNNAAPGTIGGCLNSVSTSSRLLGSGIPSITGDSLRFELIGAPPGAFCILNSGDAVAPTNMANPCFGMDSGAQSALFDGLRCAVMNTSRHGGRSADGQGTVGMTNNGWGPPSGPPIGLVNQGGFTAGQTRAFQVIHRDDPMASCMRGLNTSQAVSYTILP